MWKRGAESAMVAVAALAIGAVVWMMPGSASAFFSAPLVQCQSVTVPATLTDCGSDPLVSGVATIDDEGDLEISISGAAASQTYTTAFVGPSGVKALPNLNTGTQGNGLLRSPVFFSLGKIGAGNIFLSRSDSTQFVTGIAIEKSGGIHAAADFRPQLVSCAAVNVGGTVTGCGSDAFKNGTVEVDSVSGDLNVQVTGAAAAATYAVVLRSGGANLTLCSTLGPTTSSGNGQCTASPVPSFTAGTLGSGTVVLTRNGFDQAYSGFRVSLKPRPKPAATAGLVQCIPATGDGALSANCGADPLAAGSAVLSQNGVLKVSLTGAAPSTDYEVFFRPINSSGADDVDTKIAITTDTSGDGKGSATIAPAGTVGSGNFVVKLGASDEFLSGFTIK